MKELQSLQVIVHVSVKCILDSMEDLCTVKDTAIFCACKSRIMLGMQDAPGSSSFSFSKVDSEEVVINCS